MTMQGWIESTGLFGLCGVAGIAWTSVWLLLFKYCEGLLAGTPAATRKTGTAARR